MLVKNEHAEFVEHGIKKRVPTGQRKVQIKLDARTDHLVDAFAQVAAAAQNAAGSMGGLAQATRAMAQKVDEEMMSLAEKSVRNHEQAIFQCANDILRRQARGCGFAPVDVQRLSRLSQRTKHVRLPCPKDITAIRDIGKLKFDSISTDARTQNIDEERKEQIEFHNPINGNTEKMSVSHTDTGRYNEIMIAAEANEPRIGEHVYDESTGELLGVVSYVKDIDPRDLMTYTVYIKPNSGKSPKRTMRVRSKSIVAKASDLDFPKDLIKIDSVAAFMAWVEA